jgi:hypothetical protein
MSQPSATCREVYERASALLDGEDGPEWDALRAHLTLCPPCVEYVRQLELTVELLRGLPGTEKAAQRATLLSLFERWVEERRAGAAETGGTGGDPAGG